MRLICEQCAHGYSVRLQTCPFCGASSTFAHTSDVTSCVDVECYRDYFLILFETGECFQLTADCDFDRSDLQRVLTIYTLVTFNGEGYDIPMITLALRGFDNAALKRASDMIIVQRVKHWDLLRSYGVESTANMIDHIDHIDLMNVAPGEGGLKAYGAKMHTRKLQELPINPDASIAWHDRVILRHYCRNDLTVTRELYNMFTAQLKLRVEMGEEYGVELRSKSDAQIAEAVMRQLLPERVYPPDIAPGSEFYYRAPDWVKFTTLNVLDFFKHPFSVNEKGGISPHPSMTFVDWGPDQMRLHNGTYISKPAGWRFEPLQIGDTSYAMGLGGLHSMESRAHHVADENTVIRDHDVAGYYPHLIVRLGIYPRQIGERFQHIYAGWRTRRLEAKHAGDKKTANSLKTLNNGTFGKLGSKYSIFYAPAELIQVTITGQLALLMLVEMLELHSIAVVSANTDGIVIKCAKSAEPLADNIIAWWESVTQFETERTDYSAIYARDVNSYIAIKTDGEVKLKGAFAPPDPGASGWPNPTGTICVEAVVALLQKGTQLADTIRACDDIRKFLYVRAVKGGGALCPGVVLPKKASKKFKIETCGSVEAYDAAADIAPNMQYLGKIVRWYYARDSNATIRYLSNGNLVPTTIGCAPVMDLPDTLPGDIDYDWYERECLSLLEQVGINYGK